MGPKAGRAARSGRQVTAADPKEEPGQPTGSTAAARPAFDSHLHLTDARFDEDRPDAIARARAVGVVSMTSIATDPEDARRAVALAREEPGVWATAGLHPHAADRFSPELLGEVRRLLDEPEVVAVGETGLDFHYENAPRARQRESFEAHLTLAGETGLPAVVHSRDADRETVEAIREAGSDVRGVLHCFTGGEALLAAGLAADWYVSFSGILTFASELEPHARRVPADRLLVETDSPYLAPAPRRGRRNEPAYLRHTIEMLAALRGLAPGEAADLTRRNAERFYGVRAPAPGR